MADLALGLELEGRLVGMTLFIVAVIARALGVHEIKVEVINAAGLQLALEEGPDIRLCLEKVAGQLVGEDVLFARIAAGQAGLERRLALALNVAVRGVEIVEARFEERVHHAAGFGRVDLRAVHGQAHTAEAEVLLNVFHIDFSFQKHVKSAFFR